MPRKNGSSADSDPPFLYDSLVTVLVGPEKYRFDLHRGLLCESSDFFNAALNGRFRERKGKVTLPDQETRIFKFFVHWLYTRKLRGFYYPKTVKPSLEELKNAVLDELEDRDMSNLQSLSLNNAKGRAFNLANYRDAPFSDLVALYILADTLQVHDLKDPIVTLIIEVYGFEDSGEDVESEHGEGEEEIGGDEAETDNAPNVDNDDEEDEQVDDDDVEHIAEYTPLFWSLHRPVEIEDPVKGINMAWETLPARSPLCKLLVRCFCNSVMDVTARTRAQDYHAGFLAAIAHEYALRWAKGQSAFEGTDWDKEGEICRFHEHDRDDECAFTFRETVRRVYPDDV